MKFAKQWRPLLATSLVWAGLSLPVQAQKPALPTLKVANVDQLLQALGPNRTIQLLPGIYHLSPGLKPTPYVKWKSPDQPTLVIQNVKNLSLIGKGPTLTKLVSTRCKGDLLDFEASSAVRLQGIGFGRMSLGQTQELDCSMGPRGAETGMLPVIAPDVGKIQNWQRLAQDITRQRSRGLELPEYTAPLYPHLLEQVRAQTQPLDADQDAIAVRTHSLRPRLGEGYRLKGKQLVNAAQQPAQAAAMVFDRSHNLLVAFDAQAQVILAVEGRNNTRQSWVYPTDWLMQKSMVPQSNAPAPNGVYAFGRLIKDSPVASHSFGSYRILIEGGVLTQREILFHSRDHRLQSEIPWQQDANDENTRTLGCFLFQDPDLNQLAQLLKDAKQPVALVVQGSYAKNLTSPEL
ncbi:MAG: hypothetical protein ACO1RX_03400 [Candidatus Sericytochromatia bacterium]